MSSAKKRRTEAFIEGDRIMQQALAASDKVSNEAVVVALRLVTTATEAASRLAETAEATSSGLRTHELVCTERHNGLVRDIKGLKNMIIWAGGIAVSVTGILVMVLAIVAWAFIKQSLKLP